ncbi:MAG TPA: hypothetical protein PLU11_12495 [Chitinophagaceae bacterium]|nr:hypothetical protein [Chitinophagaceae bacterium]HPH33091.1 hypothetical protein [Chitinophagaceae bacterium]HPN59994.1 hypothetical protein [Chitinophagaceae bacterium]
MTFLEALYGSQYHEIQQRGGDGSKARFNGNLLLAVMVLLGIMIFFLAAIKFVPGFNESITRQVRGLFGYSSGKTIGRLLALPFFFLLFWILQQTTGKAANFKKYVDGFLAYPEEIKKQGNKKILFPFFILLGIVILLVLA